MCISCIKRLWGYCPKEEGLRGIALVVFIFISSPNISFSLLPHLCRNHFPFFSLPLSHFCPYPLLKVIITQKVIAGVYPGVTTSELDTLAAETAASLTSKHPDYAVLAARIAVSNLHKMTKKNFSGSKAEGWDGMRGRVCLSMTAQTLAAKRGDGFCVRAST